MRFVMGLTNFGEICVEIYKTYRDFDEKLTGNLCNM